MSYSLPFKVICITLDRAPVLCNRLCSAFYLFPIRVLLGSQEIINLEGWQVQEVMMAFGRDSQWNHSNKKHKNFKWMNPKVGD